LDAKKDLLKAALVERFDDVTNLLSAEDNIRMTDCVMRLLVKNFPNTWESDMGHQHTAWKACEMCLPYVKFLVKQVRK